MYRTHDTGRNATLYIAGQGSNFTQQHKHSIYNLNLFLKQFIISIANSGSSTQLQICAATVLLPILSNSFGVNSWMFVRNIRPAASVQNHNSLSV